MNTAPILDRNGRVLSHRTLVFTLEDRPGGNPPTVVRCAWEDIR